MQYNTANAVINKGINTREKYETIDIAPSKAARIKEELKDLVYEEKIEPNIRAAMQEIMNLNVGFRNVLLK